MTEIDELRPPTAWRLLEIWRQTRESAEELLERGLLCNAQVLAESCLCRGRPVFPDGAAVLEQLTAGEMEALLRRLAGEEQAGSGKEHPGRDVNGAFDEMRFRTLKEM